MRVKLLTNLLGEVKGWVAKERCPIEDEAVRRIRSDRFVASWFLALAACVVFTGASVITQSPRGIFSSALAIACLAYNAYLFWKRDEALKSARFMVQWGLLVLFSASFNDGQTKSETLWMIGLLPMMASYLLSRRCWFNATVGASAVITLVYLVHSFTEVDQQIREEPIDLIVYRISILCCYSAVAMFATITSYRQINELRRRDAELSRAQKSTQSAIEAKSRFLANMSHEIRTPMHGILGTTQLLLDCGLSPRQREEARVIANSGESLLRILNNILDISKIEAGKFKVNSRAFDSEEWIEAIRAKWEPLFQEASLDFHILGEPDRVNYWVSDAERLTQVIDQLLHNALRFTEEGSVSWNFSVTSSRAAGSFLAMTLKDTGPGISQADMDRVFDVFERDVGADGLGAQGMGLGLTISRQLLELMGASIELVNPDDPNGACFKITVPVGLKRRSSGETNLFQKVPARNLRGLRVLVADDQQVNLRIASAQLEQLGCSVVTAIDGAQAVVAANQSSFDIILMDLNMPRLNGWQAARNIQQSSHLNHDTPIIALTADDQFSAEELEKRGGMVDQLPKPFTPAILQTALARHAKP